MFSNVQLNYIEDEIHTYQENALKEARLYQMSKALDGPKPSLWRTSAWQLGILLVTTGDWLQRHAQLTHPLVHQTASDCLNQA